MDFPEFRRKSEKTAKFLDAIPDKKPEVGWFYEMMGALAVGRTVEIYSPKQKLLTRDDEYVIFRAYNWYRYLICREQSNRKPKSRPLTDAQKSRLLVLHAQSLKLEELLASFNLGLLVAMARRVRGDVNQISLTDFISDGGSAMVRAIRKFDATKGYKFSTYFCRSAIKQMWRDLQTKIKIRDREINMARIGGTLDEGGHDKLVDMILFQKDTLFTNQTTNERLVLMKGILQDSLGIFIPENMQLTDKERKALILRFSPTPTDRMMTLADIGVQLSESDRPYTKERTRQIINEALVKMQKIILACETPQSEKDRNSSDFHVGLDLDHIKDTAEDIAWETIPEECVDDAELQEAA